MGAAAATEATAEQRFCTESPTAATAAADVRVPVALFAYYGQHLKIWAWARAYDDSWISHGQNLGQGCSTFRLSALAGAMNRSTSTVRRLLAGAKAKGLIRHFETRGDECRVWYSSLERIAVAVGIEDLGAIGWVDAVADLESLNIAASEIAAQDLQRASYWAAKEAEKERLKKQGSRLEPQMVRADALFNPPCEHPARVLGRKGRFAYTSEGFIPYGASQAAIARERGVSVRTIQRHLSNRYRQQPSPVRGYRPELGTCLKAQVAQRVRRSFNPEFLRQSRLEDMRRDGDRFILGPNDRWYYLRCNIYYPDRVLSRCRFRRRAIHQEFLSNREAPPVGVNRGLEDKSSLLNARRENHGAPEFWATPPGE